MSAAARLVCLSLALGASAACDAGRYERARIVAYRAYGADPTAVGEDAFIVIEAKDARGESPASTDFYVKGGTCSLPGCTVTKDMWGIFVHSDGAGLAHVTLDIDAEGLTAFDFDVPFRVPTKLIVRRAIGDSPAGTRFAMVPGDKQAWFVAPGDDEGPLVADARKIEGPTAPDAPDAPDASDSAPPRCVPDTTTDAARRYGATQLLCWIGSASPTTQTVTFRYRDLTRTETVRVVPLEDVREASLVTCRQARHRVEESAFSSRVDLDLVAIEDPAPPCAPATSLHFPGLGCSDSRDYDVVVPRLVLEGGTVALGGAQFLADDQHPFSSSEHGIGPVEPGSGHVIGKFGEATLSVPYVAEPPCVPQ